MNNQCPECGRNNEQGAAFCSTCGIDLVDRNLDWRAKMLFFGTPPVLMIFSMALAWDLGTGNPLEAGAEWGLILASIFLFAGGGFWWISRALGKTLEAIDPWHAGIFSVLQLPAAIFLALPLQIIWLEERWSDLSAMSFADENNLRLLLLAVIYIPLTLAGLLALGRKTSGPLFRFGPLLVLALTILTTLGLYVSRPAHQKNYLWAQLYAESGFLGSAMEHIQKSLNDAPDQASYLHFKSLMLIGREDPSQAREAVEILRKLVGKKPAQARYELALSLALDRSGNLSEALEVASRAVDLKPREANLWAHLATLYLKKQEKREAIAAYRKALDLAPEDFSIQNNLAYTLLELNQDIVWALELARSSVTRNPGVVYNQDTLAWALFQNGFKTEAYDVIKDVKPVAKGMIEVDYHYAVIADSLGLIENSQKTFEELMSRPELDREPALMRQVEGILVAGRLRKLTSPLFSRMSRFLKECSKTPLRAESELSSLATTATDVNMHEKKSD